MATAAPAELSREAMTAGVDPVQRGSQSPGPALDGVFLFGRATRRIRR